MSANGSTSGEIRSVLHLTSSESLSGGTRQAMVLAAGLRRRGLRIVFGAPPDSAPLTWAREQGFDTHSLTCDSLREQWKASRELRRIVQASGVELVHTHHTKAHNVGLLATFGGGLVPLVANRGVLFAPKFPLKFRSPRTSALITNSKAVKRVLVGGGVAAGKIHVVYNAKAAPDLEALGARLPGLRQELGIEEGAAVVGTVGNGKPAKGFQYLVEAAPSILDAFPGVTFVLVGAATEHLWGRIESLGLGARFRLPGHREDASSLMGLFDVFALPSVDMESCPNVVLEAMGAERPVVGSDVGGVAEIVEDGETGLVVPPGDPPALARAVCDLLGDPARARVLGEKGREELLARFSLARKVEGTLDVYRTVLGRSVAAPGGEG